MSQDDAAILHCGGGRIRRRLSTGHVTRREGLAMKTKLLVVAIAVVLLGRSSLVEAQTTYTFTTLDDPLASSVYYGTEAFGINDKSQIIGNYFDDNISNGYHHSQGFIYSAGTYTNLVDPSSSGFYYGTIP